MFFWNLLGHRAWLVLIYLLLFSIIVFTTPVSCSTLSCFLYRIVLFLQYIQLFHVQTIFIPALHLAVSCTKYIYCCSTFSCFLHRISKRTIMISSFSLIRFKDFFVRGLEKWNAIYIYVHVHSTLHTENSRSYRFKFIPQIKLTGKDK